MNLNNNTQKLFIKIIPMVFLSTCWIKVSVCITNLHSLIAIFILLILYWHRPIWRLWADDFPFYFFPYSSLLLFVIFMSSRYASSKHFLMTLDLFRYHQKWTFSWLHIWEKKYFHILTIYLCSCSWQSRAQRCLIVIVDGTTLTIFYFPFARKCYLEMSWRCFCAMLCAYIHLQTNLTFYVAKNNWKNINNYMQQLSIYVLWHFL